MPLQFIGEFFTRRVFGVVGLSPPSLAKGKRKLAPVFGADIVAVLTAANETFGHSNLAVRWGRRNL